MRFDAPEERNEAVCHQTENQNDLETGKVSPPEWARGEATRHGCSTILEG